MKKEMIQPLMVVEDKDGLHYVSDQIVITDDNVWDDGNQYRMMDYKETAGGWKWIPGGTGITDDAQVVAVYEGGRYRTVQPEKAMATMKDLREWSTLSRPAFGKKYNIPYRTMQKWELGDATPAQHVVMLLERCVLADCILPELEKELAFQFTVDPERLKRYKTYMRSFS